LRRLDISQLNKETALKLLLNLMTIFSVFSIFFIILFLIKESLPFLKEKGLEMLFVDTWRPIAGKYGIIPLLLSSLLVSLLAILISGSIGIISATYLVEYANKKIAAIIRAITELLAGIPSVVYGFFGLMVIVKLVQITFDLASGETILAGAITLAIMTLPIIVSVACDAISSVPKEYREASLALGATKLQTIFRVVLPCSFRGILTGIILAFGRAIGETMAVVMVVGNVAQIPSILKPGEPITSAILLEMGEAAIGSMHYHALFTLGLILLLISLALCLLLNKIK